MAIYTRFGSEVKVISFAEYPDHHELVVQRKEDGRAFACHLAELKADGGWTEIEKAIEIVKQA